MKKSSKSGFFSQPKTMLENRAQTIEKTQKMNSNKSFQSEQSYSIQSRPGGLREALTIIFKSYIHFYIKHDIKMLIS